MDSRKKLQRTLEVLEPYVSAERRARIDEVLACRTEDVTVVLEDIFGDHNSSAVLRTADAYGVSKVNVLKYEADFRLSPKVAQGSHKWLELESFSRPEDLCNSLHWQGYQVWASHLHAKSVPVTEIPKDKKIAVIFGNEHAGVSEETMKHVDGVFMVPMHGFVESFNISVAAALTIYELVERRRQRGTLNSLPAEKELWLKALWYSNSVRAAQQLLSQEGLELPKDVEIPYVFSDDDRFKR